MSSPVLNLSQTLSAAAMAAPLLELFAQNNFTTEQPSTALVTSKENGSSLAFPCTDCTFNATTPRRLQGSRVYARRDFTPPELRHDRALREWCSYQNSSDPAGDGFFVKHRAQQHGDGKFTCQFCDFTSAYQSNLYRHLKQYHSIKKEQRTFPCVKGLSCSYVALTAEELQMHSLKLHPETQQQQPQQQYMCRECGDVLATNTIYQEHLRTYHNAAASTPGDDASSKTPVSTCSPSSAADWGVDTSAMTSPAVCAESPSSLQTKYSRKYPCNRCAFVTRDASDYLHHQRDEHGEQMHISYCHLCSYASKTLAKVKRHQELIHGIRLPKNAALVTALASGQGVPLLGSTTTNCSDGTRTTPLHDNDEDSEDTHDYEEDGLDEEDDTKLMIDERPTENRQTIPQTTNHVMTTTAAMTCSKCDFSDARTPSAWHQHRTSHGADGKFLCLRCDFSEATIQAMLNHCTKHHVVHNRSVSTQSDESWGDLEARGVKASVQVVATSSSSSDGDAGGSGGAWAIGTASKFRLNPAWTTTDVVGGAGMAGARLASGAAGQAMNGAVSPAAASVFRALTVSPRGLANAAATAAAIGKGSAQTLDQLVAQKASPNADFSQIYMTEEEAIETPDPEEDLQSLGSLPEELDVNSRTCSICGYQGKWISEMIRHKRVHTNQRPFKCRKCNRTSKWKADLIRHVAKAHGIRVVSKYSRNKSLEATDVAIMRNTLKQQQADNAGTADQAAAVGSPLPAVTGATEAAGYQRNTPQSIKSEVVFGSAPGGGATRKQQLQQQQQNALPVTTQLSIKVEAGGTGLMSHKTTASTAAATVWKCVQCAFEQESRTLVFDHLYNVHCLSPYACRDCDFACADRAAAVAHCQSSHPGGTAALLVEHAVVAVEGANKAATTDNSDSYSDNSDHQQQQQQRQRVQQKPSASSSDNSSTVSSLTSSLSHSPLSAGAEPQRQTTASPSSSIPNNTNTNNGLLACQLCPHVAADQASAVTHVKCHQRPVGLINYKCHFCDWYARKKTSVEEHMALHTDRPAHYMADVERNLITPMSFVARTPPPPLANTGSAQLTAAKTASTAKITYTDLRRGSTGGGVQNGGVLQSPPSLLETSDEMDDDAADGTPGGAGMSTDDKEDRLSYLHAGIDWCRDGFVFARIVPPRIQKVRVGGGAGCAVTGGGGGGGRAMWQCRYCGHRSKRRANVRMHEKTHFKALPSGEFRCPDCQHFRGARHQLNRHYRSNHMTSEQLATADGQFAQLLACAECPARFKADADLLAHRLHHGATQLALACVHCSYSTATQDQLKLHAKVHTVCRTDEPLAADDSATAAVSLPAQLKQQTPDETMTAVGGAQPPEKNNNQPQQPAAAHPMTTPSAAASIASIFPNGFDLQRATNDILMQYFQKVIQQNQSAAAQLFAAASAGGFPASPPAFATSVASPISASPVQQRATPVSTPTSTPVSAAPPKPKRYRCTRCDAKFTDNTQLKRHIGFHGLTPRLAHGCPLCDYSVPFPINLVKHLRSHHGLQITHMTEVDELTRERKRQLAAELPSTDVVDPLAKDTPTTATTVSSEPSHPQLCRKRKLSVPTFLHNGLQQDDSAPLKVLPTTAATTTDTAASDNQLIDVVGDPVAGLPTATSLAPPVSSMVLSSGIEQEACEPSCPKRSREDVEPHEATVAEGQEAAIAEQQEAEEARVTPAADGSLKIRISLGKRKTPSPPTAEGCAVTAVAAVGGDS